jgi:catechol 2,3-dioxygenase-like lactoylglutathione lyase family enzyme
MRATLQSDTPARLHHLHIESADAPRLARFYAEQLGCRETSVPGQHILIGPRRAMIISEGHGRGPRYAGYALRDNASLGRLRSRIMEGGVICESLDDALFQGGAFTVADPQGRRVAFGVSALGPVADGAPARLQHTVFQTTDLNSVIRFYVEKIGFSISDEVVDEDSRTMVVFMRSDDEHHSLAFFRGSRNEWDHHCYETDDWNDIRDWGDRFARAQIPIFFGPGRHGPGNNLFFMVTDPDGNNLEFSAELETVGVGKVPGIWPHGERTLNTWGRAWVRS